jgi:hypothetical protein
MSFQLTFLGYYPIKSPQLKKQTHSVKRRNWSHRERTAPDGRRRRTAIVGGLRQTGQPSASVRRPWRTAPAAGGRPPLPVVGGRSAPSVRRSQWPTDGGWPPRRTSVGSSDTSGRPADAAVDVRTRDNPGRAAMWRPSGSEHGCFLMGDQGLFLDVTLSVCAANTVFEDEHAFQFIIGWWAFTTRNHLTQCIPARRETYKNSIDEFIVRYGNTDICKLPC